MNRITIKDLNSVCKRLSVITKTPDVPYKRNAEGRLVAQVGCYFIDEAYGGYKLMQMTSDGGSCREVLATGFTTKANLYQAIHAYMSGLLERDSLQERKTVV